MNQHPVVLATEQRLFGNFCQLFPNPDGSSTPRQTVDSFVKNFAYHYHAAFGLGYQTLHDDLLKNMLDFLIRFGLETSKKNLLIDKITPYLGTSHLVLKKITHLFPHAKIIHLVRDGRDVATSGVFDWLIRGSKDTSRYRYFVEGISPPSPARFFDEETLAEWIRYWLEPIKAIHAAKNLQVLTVKFEEMLNNQADTLSKIFEFLGVPSDPELCSRCADAVTFEKVTGRKPGEGIATAKARKGIHGDWRNYFVKSDAEYFVRECGPWLKRYGYEENSAWVNACPDQWSP